MDIYHKIIVKKKFFNYTPLIIKQQINNLIILLKIVLNILVIIKIILMKTY